MSQLHVSTHNSENSWPRNMGFFKPDCIISFVHNCAENTYAQHKRFTLLHVNGLTSEI